VSLFRSAAVPLRSGLAACLTTALCPLATPLCNRSHICSFHAVSLRLVLVLIVPGAVSLYVLWPCWCRYQMNPGNHREALIEINQDENGGCGHPQHGETSGSQLAPCPCLSLCQLLGHLSLCLSLCLSPCDNSFVFLSYFPVPARLCSPGTMPCCKNVLWV